MNQFKKLLDLPHTKQEQDWLRERLKTLSVMESDILAAQLLQKPTDTAADAINHILDIPNYSVCYPAGSYEELGQFLVDHELHGLKTALDFVDLTKLGEIYEDKHPGLFVGHGYVQYPDKPTQRQYDGTNLRDCEDNDWSVKLKLASRSCPEGVWVRLPDYSVPNDGKPDEVVLALHELRVNRVDECTVLEARCILSEAGDLLEQYDSVADLIYDGNDLGFVLDEKDQGRPNFDKLFAAALDYEKCQTLAFALDIAQNLHCYDFILADELEGIAVSELKAAGVPENVIYRSVDLEGYAEQILSDRGYVLDRTGSVYIARNDQEFVYDRSAPEPPQMEMS